MNPFEDPDAKYFVLINEEGQHSLWPIFADVPSGWEAIFGEEGRQECLDFIEKNWTDMRPNSLIRQMEADAAARQSGASGNGASGNGASGNGASGTGASGAEQKATKKRGGSHPLKKEEVAQ